VRQVRVVLWKGWRIHAGAGEDPPAEDAARFDGTGEECRFSGGFSDGVAEAEADEGAVECDGARERWGRAGADEP